MNGPKASRGKGEDLLFWYCGRNLEANSAGQYHVGRGREKGKIQPALDKAADMGRMKEDVLVVVAILTDGRAKGLAVGMI